MAIIRKSFDYALDSLENPEDCSLKTVKPSLAGED